MANTLDDDRKAQVLSCLVEGNSLRATSRITGVHRTTIQNFLVRVGEGCRDMMDETLVNLPCEQIQADEIWTFNYCKQKRAGHTKADPKPQHGDQFVFVAIDADTKLVPAFRVGKRSGSNARWFLQDLADRIDGRFQLTTDAFIGYEKPVTYLIRQHKQIDYAQQTKHYASVPAGPGRYSPPQVASLSNNIVFGEPDRDAISTSYAERNNLTMRMQMRRFTRLTNGFSKKLRNLKAAVALHFAWYNFCWIHGTLGETPAMTARISDAPWGIKKLLQFEHPY